MRVAPNSKNTQNKTDQVAAKVGFEKQMAVPEAFKNK